MKGTGDGMKRSISTLLICAILLGALTSCDGQRLDKSSETAETVPLTETVPSDSVPETTHIAQPTDEPLRISEDTDEGWGGIIQ